MKTAALYMHVSTVDQHPETQLHDLRAVAQQRGFRIVAEYIDRISGTKARRPGLGDLLRDARRGRFQVVLVWASDRIAPSVRHFLEVLDELNHLSIEFVSFRENLDTGGPSFIIIGAIAALERNLIIERAGQACAGPGWKEGTSGAPAARHRSFRCSSRSGPRAGPHPDRQVLPDLTGYRQPRAPRVRLNRPGELSVSDNDMYVLLYMLLAGALGFMIGGVYGEQVARRENAAAQVEDLFERLEKASIQVRQLSEIRTVLNDAHKHILAVSKGLKNQPR